MAEKEMAEVVLGKDKILMFRKLGDNTTAAKLALQTEHKLTYERARDVTKTKDGAITSDGGLEIKLEINAIATKDELNTMLAQSVIDGFTVEVWEIDLSSKTGNKYDALYMRGDLATWEVPANVEENASISTEMTIIGKPVAGKVTLTAEQENTILYAFEDIAAKTGVSSS